MSAYVVMSTSQYLNGFKEAKYWPYTSRPEAINICTAMNTLGVPPPNQGITYANRIPNAAWTLIVQIPPGPPECGEVCL